jgi:ParB-like chromosome segregation protein Spo0J
VTAQLQLLPSTQPEQRLERVLLDRLDGYVDANPGRELREQLRALGLLQPIIAVPGEGDRFRIVDGRRRAKAIAQLAEEGDWPEPAEVELLVLKGSETAPRAVRSGLTLALHASRGPSPASELAAIEAILQTAGHQEEAATIKQITAQTGLSVQTVRRRLRLRSLSPGLRAALDRGELSASVAEAATRLPQTHQQQLECRLADGTRITVADVRGLLREQATAATGEFPDGLFKDQDPPWQATVRGHLIAALHAIPYNRRDTRLTALLADAFAEGERP